MSETPRAEVTVIAPSLSADERRLMDSVRMMADSSLYPFMKFVLRKDQLVDRVHRPYCNFLTSALLRRYRKPVVWEGTTPGRTKWRYGNSPKTLPAECTDWDGDAVNEAYPRITRDRARPYKMGLLPRKGFKTTCGSLGISLWVPATCDPDSSMMLVYATQPLSDTMGEEIDAQLLTNPRFRYLYGEWEKGSRNWQGRTKVYNCRKRPDRTPSLMMTSIGADITGLHPTCLILDDPINENNYCSDSELAAIERYHNSLFALDPDFMWVHGTRWGPTDLYGQRILEQLENHYDVYIRAAYNPDETLWCPELFPKEKLDAKLDVMGSFLYCSQYLNRVVSRSDRPLPLKSIKWFDPAGAASPTNVLPPKRADMVVLLWCDPSGMRAQGTWGLPVIGLTRDSKDDIHFWLLDHVKAPLTAKRAAEQFCALWWKYRPDCCGCENTGFSQGFMDETLIPAMRRSGIPQRLTQSRPGIRDKASRVEAGALGTMMERGLVHARRDDYAFRSEVAMFPSGSYDLLDISAQALKEAYEHDWFPAAAKKVVERTGDANYQRVMDDTNRVLRRERRRELAKLGIGGEALICESLREVFRDAAEMDRAGPKTDIWGNDAKATNLVKEAPC